MKAFQFKPLRPLLFLSLALCLLFASVSPARAAGPMLLGIYYGSQGWKMEQVQAVESWQGQKHAVVNLFTNWDSNNKTSNNLFTQQVVNVWNNKNIPMITWEPMHTNAPNDIEARIANGQYDTYINAWADKMKIFLSGADGVYGTADDRRAYLRLGHEMNGNWYPWSAAVGANTPADYINMWKHVRAIFSAKGMESTRLQWVWCVNNEDVGGFAAESFYPGDAFVDWIAVDGYNWGLTESWSSWKGPADTYGNMIGRLRAISARPLAATEFASTTEGGNKASWIGDTYSYLASQNVKMVVWFNEDKETDWAVFGGTGGDTTFKYGRVTYYKAYSSYKTAVNTYTSGPDTNNPRLLTDAQFAGN